MQRQKLRSSRQLDANFRLPFDLTPTFKEKWKPLPSRKAEYLAKHLWSKFVSRDTAPPQVRRTRAINKWLATENENLATNERLIMVDPGFNILPRVRYDTFLAKVSDIVRNIVGDVVPSYLTQQSLLGDDIEGLDVTKGSFSGGATTSRKRTEAHPSGKYLGKADVTLRCLPYAVDSLESTIWGHYRDPIDYRVVEGNVLFTVPKTTEIDRCACKEPDLNMYFQKGVGDYFRSRLRKHGIDLNDQTRNQSLARAGSIDGSLATIDLSSASDSISRELVFQCLPALWYTFLDDLRSPITIIDGDRHVNEMFSSMGNGFTFELESLLFYAIARATAYFTGTSGAISVYGDDIIVPTQMCHDLIFVLGFLGFQSNLDKTMFTGEIRESCGGHYSSGYCITPFYIRKPIETLHDVITLANQIRKWSGEDHGLSILDLDIEEIWLWLASFVPKCFWGGIDTNSSDRLVSYWKPSSPKRLVPVTRSKPSGDGGYLYWLDTKGRLPNSEGMESSSVTSPSGKFRSKPVRWQHGELDSVFLQELQMT